MAPMAAGPAPPRKDWANRFARSAPKWRAPARMNTNDGANAIERRQQRAAHAGGGVADDRHRLHHRAPA